MANGDIITCFQKLGLSEYESKALSALLSRHDATAQQIADSGEIPITKVYSVLSSLEKQGLLKCTLERPKKYRPLDPESLMNVILGKRKTELERLEKTVSKKFDVLNEMYKEGETFQGNEKVIFLPSFEAVWSLVLEITTSAKNSIYTLADGWIYQHAFKHDKTMIEGVNACDRGVKYRCIMPASISDIFEKIRLSKYALSWLSHENTNIRIIDDNRIHHNLLVKDEESMGMSFKDIKTGEIISGMAIYDELVTKGTSDYFNSLWYSAMPVENEIRREAQRALEKLEQEKSKKKITAKV